MSADLTCVRRPAGWRCRSSAAAPGDVRRRHARPVEDGERRRRRSAGSRRGSARPARRRRASAACSNAVGPADEKLVIDAAAPGLRAPERARPKRTVVAAAASRQVGAQRGAVEVGDHPGRDVELDRDRVRLAGAVVDEHDADRAGGAAARPPSTRSVQPPRRRARSCPRASRPAACVVGAVRIVGRRRRAGGRPAGRRCRSIEPTSTSVWSLRLPRRGRAPPLGRLERESRERRGRARRGHVSAGAKTWSVRDGRDGDRVGRGARRAGGAEAEVVAVVAGRDDRHDARRPRRS